MNTRYRIECRAALAAALLLPGCAATTPQWDGRFGDAIRGALAAQVAAPAAARNPDPVAGLDGKAARAAQERYEKSFVTPPAAPQPLSISLGGAK